jgi:predicted dehydrogenase
MKRIRAAVVGTGFIGPVHVEALRRAGVEVAGIVGSTPEKSVSTALYLGLPTTLLTFDDILNDPSIDSVHLTTPNKLHFEQAVAVLEADKHVLCEKPLAMDSRQSSHLVQLASQSGKAAGVAYNIRYYPLCHEAASRVAQGKLGEFFHVSGSYVQDWLLLDSDFNWRVLAEEGGELRAIADIGTHWLDLIQFITGQKVVSVCADLRTVHKNRLRPKGGVETFAGKAKDPKQVKPIAITTEDCGCVMLRFENGANGCLWVSQTTAGRKNCLRFELAGQSSTLNWNSEEPNQMWIGYRSQPNELLIRDPALLNDNAANMCNYPGGHNEGFPDTFKQLFKQFYGYIANGNLDDTAPFPTFADGHYEILLCESIVVSHRERRWVDVRW